ncbi:unnamed protein product, partial [Prorocentrum cordatum]
REFLLVPFLLLPSGAARCVRPKVAPAGERRAVLVPPDQRRSDIRAPRRLLRGARAAAGRARAGRAGGAAGRWPSLGDDGKGAEGGAQRGARGRPRPRARRAGQAGGRGVRAVPAQGAVVARLPAPHLLVFRGHGQGKGGQGQGQGRGQGRREQLLPRRPGGNSRDVRIGRVLSCRGEAADAKDAEDAPNQSHVSGFVWTFSRAGVVLPSFMQSVGDHMLSRGQIPMCDRCSLGTMVWNFSQCGVSHDRYFEGTASECVRPNRLRSLAPRNFQNTMIAFARRRHWHEKYVDAMARGMVRLLDSHDPRFPKTDTSVLFSYTCKDGSEVPADAFRITSLTVILRQAQALRAGGPGQPRELRRNWEQCCASMRPAYVRRSAGASPAHMCRRRRKRGGRPGGGHQARKRSPG